MHIINTTYFCYKIHNQDIPIQVTRKQNYRLSLLNKVQVAIRKVLRLQGGCAFYAMIAPFNGQGTSLLHIKVLTSCYPATPSVQIYPATHARINKERT